MKHANHHLFVAFLFSLLLSACSGTGAPQLIEPTLTSIPSSTVRPTETGTPTPTSTSTATSTPTSIPTPTITPTPSLTPLAGVGGIVTVCHYDNGGTRISGYYFVDLSSMEYRLLERYTLSNWDQRPAYQRGKMLLELKMKGVSDDFLARLRFPDDFFSYSATVVQVSADGDEILFFNTQRLGSGIYTHDFSLVTRQNPSWKNLETSNMELINNGEPVRYSSINNHVIMYLVDENETVDLYLINMSTGQVKNLTGMIEDPIYDGRWSPDGSKIAFSTGDGIWVIDGQSEPVLTIPGGVYPEWNSNSKTLVYKKDGGYSIADWDGSNEEKLTLLDGGVKRVQWVPDGKRLIYWGFYNQERAWLTADLEAGTIAPLLTELPHEFMRYSDSYNSFTWSPDQHWFWGWSMGESALFSELRYYVCNIDNLECFRLDDHPTEDGMRCSGLFWPAANHAYQEPLESDSAEILLGEVYLADLGYSTAEGYDRLGVGVFPFSEGPAVAGKVIKAEGKEYAYGLFAHAPYEITYDLWNKYSLLKTTLVMANNSNCVSNGALFRVLVDGKEVFLSDLLTPANTPLTVEILITGKQLTLETLPGPNDDNGCDWTVWGDPVLIP